MGRAYGLKCQVLDMGDSDEIIVQQQHRTDGSTSPERSANPGAVRVLRGVTGRLWAKR